MKNKYIIYNMSNLEDYEICDYLKSVMILGEKIKEGEWKMLNYSNGISAEICRNKKSKTIAILGNIEEE